MRNIYRQLYDILNPRDRRKVIALFGVMLLAAILETVGVASILPFIAVLANPGIIEQNRYLNSVYESLGFASPEAFMVFLGAVFFILFVVGLLARATAFWAQARFSNTRMHQTSSRLFAGYLGKDYEWFLNRHSSALASTVLYEVSRVIHEVLFPSLQIIAHVLVLVLLMSLLIAVDPVLAASVVVVLGGSYLIIYLSMRRWVGRVGQTGFTSNRARYRITQEALGGIKGLKIKGLEQRFQQLFQSESDRLARSRIAEQLIGQVPSYAMQGIIFGGMLLVVLYLMTVHGDLGKALPILATYAVAGYRMMPSLQDTYRQLVTIRSAEPALEAIHAELQSISYSAATSVCRDDDQRLPLTNEIRLVDACYRYPGVEQDALSELRLEIPRYSTVALVGPTGCGKTTTVDVILGLLSLRSGALEVDGTRIGDTNRRQWQRNIGYVPQEIFLVDASVAGNIAYGLEGSEIDMAAVERAARIANLHEFVTTELPEGYATFVGERGVRLSGGQRQRIGIARALYHDPEVMVLDEATSALDNLTEHAVMEAVRQLARKKTIIMVAHRLSTVRACDKIFLLEHGRVVAQGTYEELLEKNDFFRRMAADPDFASVPG